MPRRFDRAGIVVLANPIYGALRRYATKLGDARKSGPRAALATSASDLNANAFRSQAMRLVERGPCILSAERQPEVRPAKPSNGPGSRSGRSSQEVERPPRPRLGCGAVAKAAAAETRTVG